MKTSGTPYQARIQQDVTEDRGTQSKPSFREKVLTARIEQRTPWASVTTSSDVTTFWVLALGVPSAVPSLSQCFDSVRNASVKWRIRAWTSRWSSLIVSESSHGQRQTSPSLMPLSQLHFACTQITRSSLGVV